MPDRFDEGPFAFLKAGLLGFAKGSSLRITARPGNQTHRSRSKEIDPQERRLLCVELDDAVPDQILPDVSLIQIPVQRGLQLTGMRTAAGELALSPAGKKVGVDSQQAPPAQRGTLGIGFEIRPACCQVENGGIRSVTVEQQDLLEAVVGEAFADIDDDGAGFDPGALNMFQTM